MRKGGGVRSARSGRGAWGSGNRYGSAAFDAASRVGEVSSLAGEPFHHVNLGLGATEVKWAGAAMGQPE